MYNSATISPVKIREEGSVKAVKKVIAEASGLSSFMNGQLVNFSSGVKGIVVGFAEEDILVLILGDESKVRRGQEVYSTQEEFKIPVGERFLGRIVSVFGEACDGKGKVEPDCYCRLFREPSTAMDRGELDSYLEVGTKIIDAVVPIAKGQRQLIIGDRMTGKTTIGVDAILSQKGKDVICIYCCIGKSFSSFLKVVQLLKLKGALDYTIVLAAIASVSVGEQYLAPYTAATLGEYFMYKGKDVLVVFDDMTKHVWSYREISLLLERPPGKEAYPGDIYYIHSQLMERAGKLNKELGGGSMTFLPIAETLQGDVTGLISSNLISMTDGQIYLSSSLFAEGFKPAIDLSMSVSIIGDRTQNAILKRLASTIRLEYLRYRELLRLTKLKATLSSEATRKMKRGEVIAALFTQEKNKPIPIEESMILLCAFNMNLLNELDIYAVNRFKDEIGDYIRRSDFTLFSKLGSAKELTTDITTQLDRLFVNYFKQRQKE